MRYDALHDLDDPEKWLATEDAEKIFAVEHFHRRKRIRLPNLKMHAIIHVVVENQVAMGDALPAKAVLSRLMSEGLDRHDAIHAIGSVVAGEIYTTLKNKPLTHAVKAEYLERLERLTAKSWLRTANPSP